MDTSSIQTLITTTATNYGLAVLAVITVTIGIGVAYLLFRFGWFKINSVFIGGVETQYRGPNKFPDVNNFKDMMEFRAYNRGRQLNKKDGLSF